MQQLSLFLGMRPDFHFEELKRKENPHVISLLTKGGDYLMELTDERGVFIGKKISESLTWEELEIFEVHVMSLLKKLVPAYPFSSNPLILLIVNE